MTTYPIRNLGVDELKRLSEFALEVSNKMPQLIRLLIEAEFMLDYKSTNIVGFLRSLIFHLDGICGEDQQIDMKKIAIKLQRDAYSCRTGKDSFQQDWEEAYYNNIEPLPTLKIGNEIIHFEDKL